MIKSTFYIFTLFVSLGVFAMEEEAMNRLKEQCKNGMSIACQTLDCQKGNKLVCEQLKNSVNKTLKSMGLSDMDDMAKKVKESGQESEMKSLGKKCQSGDKASCDKLQNLVLKMMNPVPSKK